MIGSLRGILTAKRTGDIIVDVSGVGYQLIVPNSTLTELPAAGAEVFLHVYTHVREDALQLFGFSAEVQKRLFTTLLGVSGVGPKVALGLVSGIPGDEFYRAVEEGDISTLTSVPGVGKKTAQRIVLELRGKLPEKETSLDRAFEDALSALLNLGYRKAEARRCLETAVGKGAEGVEGLLKESLRYLSGAHEKI